MGVAYFFAETRELFKANQQLLNAIAERDRIIENLKAQLTLAYTQPNMEVQDMFKKYQEEVLSEAPFPDGKVPDAFWLTPERDSGE